jgi:hypothetical protein
VSNYACSLALLARGARLKRPDRDLRAVAMDHQSTHLTLVNLVLKRHAERAEALVAKASPEAAAFLLTELGDFQTTKQGDLRVTQQYLVHALDQRFSDAAVLRVGQDVPCVRENVARAEPMLSAAVEIRASLRSSIERFFSSLTEVPVLGAIVDTGAKVLDLVYKALVCVFVEKGCDVDVVEDVLVPLFQALLKAENEYGWTVRSCAPGSISFVLSVLEGRLDVDTSVKPLTRQRTAADTLPTYRKDLETALLSPTPQRLEAVRAEARRFCTPTAGALASDAPRAKLEAILDVMTLESAAFAYATNELRGFFFAQLAVAYDADLAEKFHDAFDQRFQHSHWSHRPSDPGYREPPRGISAGMSELLDNLFGVADAFARSFVLVVEDIPQVFATALEGCKGTT